MSHMGWFMTRTGFKRQDRYIPDLLEYPELNLLDRFDWVVPALLAVSLFALGEILRRLAPSLGTSGWQVLVWGFLISTVAVYQATFVVNSLAHTFGRRRYDTGDDSRNNAVLALFTFGEGWHNNHHHYPASARQGFFWWEIDVTYYLLRLLSWFGVIWELQTVPVHARSRDLVRR
jgi:stearoyl-CoA desaturase (Delta-9 desaturase)